MSEGGRLVVEKLVVVFMMGLIGLMIVIGLGRGFFFNQAIGERRLTEDILLSK